MVPHGGFTTTTKHLSYVTRIKTFHLKFKITETNELSRFRNPTVEQILNIRLIECEFQKITDVTIYDIIVWNEEYYVLILRKCHNWWGTYFWPPIITKNIMKG